MDDELGEAAVDEADLKRATEELLGWLVSRDIDVGESVVLLQCTIFEILRLHPGVDFCEALRSSVRSWL